MDFGIPTAIFSLEMSTVQLMKRLFVSESGIPREKIYGESPLDSEDWSKMDLLEVNLVKNNIGEIAMVDLYLDRERLRVNEFDETDDVLDPDSF